MPARSKNNSENVNGTSRGRMMFQDGIYYSATILVKPGPTPFHVTFDYIASKITAKNGTAANGCQFRVQYLQLSVHAG